MSQLHKRFTDDQIKLLFQSYCQGQVGRADLQEMIGIGKPRFFVLLKAYRDNPDRFTIAYHRKTHARISPAAVTCPPKTDPEVMLGSVHTGGRKDGKTHTIYTGADHHQIA